MTDPFKVGVGEYCETSFSTLFWISFCSLFACGLMHIFEFFARKLDNKNKELVNLCSICSYVLTFMTLAFCWIGSICAITLTIDPHISMIVAFVVMTLTAFVFFVRDYSKKERDAELEKMR